MEPRLAHKCRSPLLRYSQRVAPTRAWLAVGREGEHLVEHVERLVLGAGQDLRERRGPARRQASQIGLHPLVVLLERRNLLVARRAAHAEDGSQPASKASWRFPKQKEKELVKKTKGLSASKQEVSGNRATTTTQTREFFSFFPASSSSSTVEEETQTPSGKI